MTLERKYEIAIWLLSMLDSCSPFIPLGDIKSNDHLKEIQEVLIDVQKIMEK